MPEPTGEKRTSFLMSSDEQAEAAARQAAQGAQTIGEMWDDELGEKSTDVISPVPGGFEPTTKAYQPEGGVMPHKTGREVVTLDLSPEEKANRLAELEESQKLVQAAADAGQSTQPTSEGQ